MNDLNSVFLVGKIGNKPTIAESLYVKFLLINRSIVSDEKNEVIEKMEEYQVNLVTSKENERWKSILKKGMRIGVNGRLIHNDNKIEINAYSIQLLNAPKKNT